jgi:hypothetical protein
LKKADLCPSIHPAFDELELCDLAFGLAIRPGFCDSSMDGVLVIFLIPFGKQHHPTSKPHRD